VKPKIIDLMPVIASDQRTFDAEVRGYLKRGWHLLGETREMRPLQDPYALVYVQWVAQTDEREG
jgi:hypothetical protein